MSPFCTAFTASNSNWRLYLRYWPRFGRVFLVMLFSPFVCFFSPSLEPDVLLLSAKHASKSGLLLVLVVILSEARRRVLDCFPIDSEHILLSELNASPLLLPFKLEKNISLFLKLRCDRNFSDIVFVMTSLSTLLILFDLDIVESCSVLFQSIAGVGEGQQLSLAFSIDRNGL